MFDNLEGNMPTSDQSVIYNSGENNFQPKT